MDQFPGVGDRINQRLRALGYWSVDKQREDVMRFCREKGFLSQYFYEWVRRDRLPNLANLKKLSEHLHVPMVWILLGDDGVTDLARFAAGNGVATSPSPPEAPAPAPEPKALKSKSRAPRTSRPKVPKPKPPKRASG